MPWMSVASSPCCCQMRHQHCGEAAAPTWHRPVHSRCVMVQPAKCCHMCRACFRGRHLNKSFQPWWWGEGVDGQISKQASGVPERCGQQSYLPGACPGTHGGLVVQLDMLVCSQNCQAVQLSQSIGERFAPAGCCTGSQLHMWPDTCFGQAGQLGLLDLAFAFTIDAGPWYCHAWQSYATPASSSDTVGGCFDVAADSKPPLQE